MSEAQWVLWFQRTVVAVSCALTCVACGVVLELLRRLLWDSADLFPDVEGAVRSYTVPRIRRVHRHPTDVESPSRSIAYLGREAARAGAAQPAPSLPASGGAA